jgi:hypothetical protein
VGEREREKGEKEREREREKGEREREREREREVKFSFQIVEHQTSPQPRCCWQHSEDGSPSLYQHIFNILISISTTLETRLTH